ncbi:alpha/beta hydrolase [Blastococcus sp. VKM Ac-2987]|uniref:alpha/beta hydrolase n=1 Tax=Blastococcus sp. VKM Ac-2987 TaxID=3004141 RepID=UPI0022ABA483|nr:phospholipase [Blastococcus sp. VKM Ac-2987]MCZ2860456.1 phospholipase [Blastococcus sp. VKM Ac-2987]
MPTRRAVLGAGAATSLAVLMAGCAPRSPGPSGGSTTGRDGAALAARPPARPPVGPPAPGTRSLGLASSGDALLHVPPEPGPNPLPLVVSLHGAGGDAEAGLGLVRAAADEHGTAVLAPSSRGPTWDAVGGDYGPDAELVDRALAEVFRTVPVDPARIAVAGFSDGASYALGLGLANGGLFSRILAFSPGYVPPAPRAGAPAVFISHGVDDEVLPIDRTSRRIVPALEEDGYDVTYREFPGPHTVPPEVVGEAVAWLVGG